MAELKVELDLLERASKAWTTEVAAGLRNADFSIDELKYSAIQFGLFAGAWSSYSVAAAYIQERLREGTDAADQVGNALHVVASAYEQQQDEQAHGTDKLAGEMDFTI
ncbi:hypothetical protein AB0B25_03845 [Nocardia sp. NPDC049190]|uniref:hypothetical protein n=1 Tax=Nocardia sp. NPDC049190 TaxID=3155650 RepID=UPI0033C31482